MHELTGLLRKYPVNRRLTYEEKEGVLNRKVLHDVEPSCMHAVIKVNGTYMELAGKFYEWRGVAGSLFALIGIICPPVVILMIAVLVHLIVSKSDDLYLWPFFLFGIAVGGGVSAASVWSASKEFFRLTHYPIRLNRKLRKIYAFDPRTMKLLEMDWDKTYFTIQPTRTRIPYQQWEILALTLDDDGETVRHVLPFTGMWVAEKDVLRHWEYLRRYMEEGPEAIIEYSPVFLDIANRKETFMEGFHRLYAPFHHGTKTPFVLIFGPFMFFSAIGRHIGMLTSKIPQWPAHVEDECRTEPGDRWEYDARDNPPDYWAAVPKLRSEMIAEGMVPR